MPVACINYRGSHVGLKNISHANNHAPVSSVRAPLIQKRGIGCATGGKCPTVRYSEITSIGSIEEISPQLEPLILTNTSVLQNTEVDVVDSIGS